MNAVRWSVAFASLALVTTACTEEEAGPVYQAVAVTTRDIEVTAQAAGAILPDTVVEVKSKASGEIIEFSVETGQVVQRGQLLARIDRRIPQNRYAQAEAQFEVAQARLRNAEAQNRRARELFDANAITEQEMENSTLELANANAALVSARTELENAKISLDDTEVRAPITGTIIAKNVERGAVITAPGGDVGGGTTLLKMADLSLVQVKTFVDETDIGKLSPGMLADVTVEAFPNRPFRGEVIKIEPQADTIQNVTMFPVLVRINNRDGLLKPGMNAEVNIAVGSAKGVLAVPNAALRTERDAPSAASVLGISDSEMREMLAASSAPRPGSADSGSGATLGDSAAAAPQQDDAARMQAIFAKMRSGATLTAEEQALMQQARARMGNGGRPGGGARSGQDALFGGRYIVFTMRNGKPTPVYVQTGITDLDWSEVKSGLTADDSVLLLPSASLLQSQQVMQERMSRNSGLPGQQR